MFLRVTNHTGQVEKTLLGPAGIRTRDLRFASPFETLDYVSLTILRGEEEGEEWGEEKEKKWEMAGRGGKRKRCYRSGEHNKKKNIKD